LHNSNQNAIVTQVAALSSVASCSTVAQEVGHGGTTHSLFTRALHNAVLGHGLTAATHSPIQQLGLSLKVNDTAVQLKQKNKITLKKITNF
jgi:hypothetical protein